MTLPTRCRIFLPAIFLLMLCGWQKNGGQKNTPAIILQTLQTLCLGFNTLGKHFGMIAAMNKGSLFQQT